MARRASTLFKAPVPSSKADTTNREGFPAFKQDLESAYLQMLLTNTFGSAYYASQKELIAEAEKCHGEMLSKDLDFVAKALPYARNKGFMRTQPIYGLVRLANVPEAAKQFEEVFGEVIKTPNDLFDFFAIMHSFRKGEGGRRVKRVAGNWLLKNLSPYWAIKYGATKQGGYSFKDLFITLHPKGEKSVVVDYLFGRANEKELPEQIQCFEALKKANSEAAKVDAITKGRLPHEVASSFAGDSKKVWEAIVPAMPIFATLRNLATMERHGVMDAVRKVVIEKLTDAKTIQKSKIFPFRFVEAINHVKDAKVQDALRDALDLSFVNIPDIEGRLAVFLDISGSMGQYIQSAAIFAISAMKKAKDDGRFLLFDDRVEEMNVSMRDSTLTQAARIHARGGTVTDGPMRRLYTDRWKADTILLITDEQQNGGQSPFLDVLEGYREKVNRNAKCVILNVAPYHGALSGQLMPQDQKNAWVYGWSDAALSYVSMFSRGWGSFVEAVKRGEKVEPEAASD